LTFSCIALVINGFSTLLALLLFSINVFNRIFFVFVLGHEWRSREPEAVKVGQGITIIGLSRTYKPNVCEKAFPWSNEKI